MCLCVSNEGGDIVLMEECIGEHFWWRKAGGGALGLGSSCVVGMMTHGSSAIDAAQSDICSRCAFSAMEVAYSLDEGPAIYVCMVP